MTPKQREALELVLGYLDACECSFCGGEEPGQHTEGCPVLELRAMVATPQTLYSRFKALLKLAVDKMGIIRYTCFYN